MKAVLLMGLVLISSVFLIPLATADGMAIYTDRSFISFHGENTQIAAINYKDGKEKLMLAVKMDQLGEDSVIWIVPVPANGSDVKINILKEFPQVMGSDIILRAKTMRNPISGVALFLTAVSQIYLYPPLFMQYIYYGASEASGKDITVHTAVEKEGIVTQVISAETAEAIYNYLQSKNITVSEGSIPILDEYIGEDYSFVVSWVTSINKTSYRIPAIFIEFPTSKLFYPLKPTSLYGDRGIPVLIYVVGYAEPELYPEIENSTEYRYFSGTFYAKEGLDEFFSGASGERIAEWFRTKYTRIMIGSENNWIPLKQITTPSAENFVDDLWIELKSPPPEISKAERKIDILNAFSYGDPVVFLLIILWLLFSSVLTGLIAGLIVFRKAKKTALLGIANCLTIIGLTVATFLVSKKETLKKKASFIILFSVLFIVINILIIAPIINLILFGI